MMHQRLMVWLVLICPLLPGCDSPLEAIPDAGESPDAMEAPDASPPMPTGDDPMPPSLDPETCAAVYAQDLLPSFNVTTTNANLTALQQSFETAIADGTAAPTTTYPVVFSYSGTTITNATIRLKGPAWSWESPKMPFEIIFDEIDPFGRFQGLRQIQLDAAPYDASFLRTRLALWFFRWLGLPAACANNARLNMNGVYYGLYTNIEPIDDVFLQRVFPGEATGDLFKDGWEPVTNVITFDWMRLDQYNNTSTAAAIANMADLDQAVQEWAAEAMIPHGDGFWGLDSSYYLYDHPTRGYLYIPDDLAATFNHTEATADPISWTGSWEGAPEPSLQYATVLGNSTWNEAYLTSLDFAAAVYHVPTMQDLIDEWAAQIASAASSDPNKPFDDVDHLISVTQLTTYLFARDIFVRAWFDCKSNGGGDSDGDNVIWCNDCNDDVAAVHPGANEICGNDVDDDCDGRRDEGCP